MKALSKMKVLGGKKAQHNDSATSDTASITLEQSYIQTHTTFVEQRGPLYTFTLDTYRSIVASVFDATKLDTIAADHANNTININQHQKVSIFLEAFARVYHDIVSTVDKPGEVRNPEEQRNARGYIPRENEPSHLLALLRAIGMTNSLIEETNYIRFVTTCATSLHSMGLYFADCLQVYAMLAEDRAKLREMKTLLSKKDRLSQATQVPLASKKGTAKGKVSNDSAGGDNALSLAQEFLSMTQSLGIEGLDHGSLESFQNKLRTFQSTSLLLHIDRESGPNKIPTNHGASDKSPSTPTVTKKSPAAKREGKSVAGKENSPSHSSPTSGQQPLHDSSRQISTASLIVPFGEEEKELLSLIWKVRIERKVKSVLAFTPSATELGLMFELRATAETYQSPKLNWDIVAQILPSVFGKFSSKTAMLLCKSTNETSCGKESFSLLVKQLTELFNSWYVYEVFSEELTLGKINTTSARRVRLTIDFLGDVADKCGFCGVADLGFPEEDIRLFSASDAKSQHFLTLANVLDFYTTTRDIAKSYTQSCESNTIYPAFCLCGPPWDKPDACFNLITPNSFYEMFRIDKKVPLGRSLLFRKYFQITTFLRHSKFAVVALQSLHRNFIAERFLQTIPTVLMFFFGKIGVSAQKMRCDALCSGISDFLEINSATGVITTLQIEKVFDFLTQILLEMGKHCFDRFMVSETHLEIFLEAENRPTEVERLRKLNMSDLCKILSTFIPSSLNEMNWLEVLEFPGVLENWLEHLSHEYPNNITFPWGPNLPLPFAGQKYFDFPEVICVLCFASFYLKNCPDDISAVGNLKKSHSRMHYYTTRLQQFHTENFVNNVHGSVPLGTFMTFLRQYRISVSKMDTASAFIWWHSQNSEMKVLEAIPFITCENIVSKLISLYDDIILCAEGAFIPSSKGSSWGSKKETMQEDADIWIRVLHRVKCPVIAEMLYTIETPRNLDEAIHWFVISTVIDDITHDSYILLKWLLTLHDITALDGKIIVNWKFPSTTLSGGEKSLGSDSWSDIAVKEIQNLRSKTQEPLRFNAWNAFMALIYTTYLTGDSSEKIFEKYDTEIFDAQRSDLRFFGAVSEEVFVQMCVDVTQQPLLNLDILRPLMVICEFHLLSLYRPDWARLLLEVNPTTFQVKHCTLALFRLIFPILRASRGMLPEELKRRFLNLLEEYKESVTTK